MPPRRDPLAPPAEVVTRADARQAAHNRAAAALARRVDAMVRDAFRRALSGRRINLRPLLSLRADLERLLRGELTREATRAANAWRRVLAPAGKGRPAPLGVVEADKIAMAPFAGHRWTTRLAGHVPSPAQIASMVRPGMKRADAVDALAPVFNRARARIATLARTEFHRVNLAAQDRVAIATLGDRLVGWRYTTMDDERVRPEHVALEGTFFPLGTQRIPVPNGPNCFPGWIRVQGRFVGGLRVFYCGEVVELTTAEGHRLTVTPHHPIATVDGFRAAGTLDEGVQLIAYRGHVDSGAGGKRQGDEQDEPAPIEEVFRALAELGPRLRVRAAAEDLHGDAQATDGEVEVVGPVSGLRLNRTTGEPDEQTLHPRLVDADKQPASLTRPGSGRSLLDRANAAPRSPVGGPDLRANAGGVGLDRLPLKALGVGPAAELDLSLLEANGERASADAKVIAEMLQRLSPLIAPDRLVKIERRAWAGHVYDLQGSGGWIVAAGLLSSNCRCWYMPAVKAAPRTRSRA